MKLMKVIIKILYIVKIFVLVLLPEVRRKSGVEKLSFNPQKRKMRVGLQGNEESCLRISLPYRSHFRDISGSVGK